MTSETPTKEVKRFDRTWLEGLEFWGELEYTEIPHHSLPWLPMQLTLHTDKAVSCVPAPNPIYVNLHQC